MMTGSCTESQAKYIEFLMKDYDDDKFDDMIASHYTIDILRLLNDCGFLTNNC